MSTPADALVDRLFTAALGTFDLAGVYLGDRLGWYRSLSEDGPATPEELAERTRTDARYAREWLEQQAVGGILEVDGEHPRTTSCGSTDYVPETSDPSGDARDEDDGQQHDDQEHEGGDAELHVGDLRGAAAGFVTEHESILQWCCRAP